MAYNTFIFDLDGTLLDTLTDLADAVNFALRTHSLPERSHAEVRLMLGNGVRRLIRDAVPGIVSDDICEQVLATFRTRYFAHCMDATAPYPGMLSTLTALRDRGAQMGIVSNKPDPAVRSLGERFFAGYMDAMVGESPTVRRKPCPDSVLTVMQQLGGRADESIYIGDSEVDIATARAAGLPVGVALWGFRDEAYLRQFAGADTFFLSAPQDLLRL